MKISIKDIEFDDDIYPRRQISQKTVTSYVEALKGGATFPPIEIQQISVDDKEKIISLDGKHRCLAIDEFNKQAKDNGLEPINEIEVTSWKNEILDKGQHLEELRVRSASLNLRHGDRLPTKDLANVVLKIIKARPIERLEGIVNWLAGEFGYNQSTVGQLETDEGKVTDVLSKRKLSRNYRIWKLIQLGWTQEEVGKLFFPDTKDPHAPISKIVSNIDSNILHIQQQYEQGKSVEEVAQFNNLDLITAWRMVLQGKSDEDRFDLFGTEDNGNKSPRRYNVWNFKQRDPRLGNPYPGNIPGQIVMNILYYYTKEGDLVVDPMAGGGSTIDACLIMNRKCRAYDVKSTREDIVEHDIKKGFPDRAKKDCKLIFLDPPYGRIKRDFYSKDSISSETYSNWLEFMNDIVRNCHSVLDDNGYVVIIVEPFFDRKEENRFLDLPFDITGIFLNTGFNEYYRIHTPLPSDSTAHGMEFGKREKVVLDQARDLIIFKKK